MESGKDIGFPKKTGSIEENPKSYQKKPGHYCQT
jgi:hypothetical protein